MPLQCAHNTQTHRLTQENWHLLSWRPHKFLYIADGDPRALLPPNLLLVKRLLSQSWCHRILEIPAMTIMRHFYANATIKLLNFATVINWLCNSVLRRHKPLSKQGHITSPLKGQLFVKCFGQQRVGCLLKSEMIYQSFWCAYIKKSVYQKTLEQMYQNMQIRATRSMFVRGGV